MIQDLHGGDLVGHLGVIKTMDVFIETYFGPYMKWDIGKFVQKYYICQTAKGQAHNANLYMHLPIPKKYMGGLVYGFCTWFTSYTK